jgi:glycosyltransferase involved in cell wall biosynthesis
MKRLAIITTHPIQYHAPVFKLLNERKKIVSKVFYTWSQSENGNKFDPGFGKEIEWDIPLLEGYEYSFTKNIATDAGTHHFKGIINPALIAEIEAWKPDAILVYGWSFKSHLKCLKYFHKRIPVYFRGDSTLLDEEGGIKKIARRFFLKWIYRYIDIAFYVGTQNKLYFLKHGLKDDQLCFAPHAIDNDRFFDKDGQYAQSVPAWRQQLNITADDTVFLFAGKLEPKKDAELLIRAFERIHLSGIQLVIVGNGILEDELKKKYVHIKNLHFVGFQNQTIMPVVYRIADVFVLPSCGPGETWGLSVNEAMACARPVLVSNKAGCAVDLVEDEKNGYVFNSRDMPDLEKKLRMLIARKGELRNMGSLSFDKIKSWNFDAIATAIENIVTKNLDD